MRYMKKIYPASLFVTAMVLCLAFSAPAAANEGCPEYPKVVWWETSHAKVASYVSRKHGGDWAPYVAKWGSQLEKMKSIHKKGGSAVFKSKDLRLHGDVLLQYINAIKDRLAVTKCLARREMANAGEKKNVVANDG